MKPRLQVIEGTSVPTWDDEEGSERVLRSALTQDLCGVVVIGILENGEIYTASDCDWPEMALGLIERGKAQIINSLES